jgi:hypothetical protein
MFPVSEWLLASSVGLLQKFPTSFEHVWAKVVPVLRSNPECAKSSGYRRNNEPDWATEALNLPVGKLAEALMKDPQKDGLEVGQGFPLPWLKRVDELLSLEEDLRRHALVMCAFHLNWFFAIDPAWTQKQLIAVLDEVGDDQNAIWAGFFWASKFPHLSLYTALKPRLLSLAARQPMLQHHHTEVLAALLLSGWGSVDKVTGERYVTDAEMQSALVNAGDDFRSRTLWQLQQRSSQREGNNGHWRAKVSVFLSEVWPRHIKAKSPRITASLFDLAFSDAASFADIADIILSLVTTSDRDHLWLPDLEGVGGNIIDNHPDKSLALFYAVLHEDVAVWPYNIEDVLERIGTADRSILKDPRLVELKRR